MTSLKKAGLLLLLLFVFYAASAQRLNTGLSIDFYGINLTKFPSEIIFSETNYKAYYIKKLQAPSGFQLQNYGLNLIADYSRFFVNTRFNLSSPVNGIIYKFSYPIGGNEFVDYYSKIYFQQTELSASFGYFIKAQRFFRPYLEAGIGRTFPYFYREDFSDNKTFKTLWTGRHEIREFIGLYKPYTYMTLGFGYRGDMFSFYSRYNIRLGNQKVFYSNLAFGMAIYTKFSKLRKHYIYQPEE
jgi:hypothetical protein